ncbi:putative plant bZIP transcription factor [Helianthus anomalus]
MVDEVWKDISKEFNGFGQPNMPQRQQTLGEMTLKEFLVKARVVREETQAQLTNNLNDNEFLNLTNFQNSPGFGAIGFQQGASRNAVVNVNVNNSNQIAFQSSNLPLNINGVRSTV